MISNRMHADRRQIFAARLATARHSTDRLFKVLRPAALLERPIPERHRLIFYVGHLEAFDRNLMADAGLGMPAISEELDRIFAFGIDPVDGALPSEPASAWPSEPAVGLYSSQVRDAVDQCLEKADLEDELLDADRALHVMIEHRLMHAETLAYAMHRLPLELKLAPPDSLPPAGELPVSSPGVRRDVAWVQVPAGHATLVLARARAFC